LLFPLRGANSTPIDGVPLKRLLYWLNCQKTISDASKIVGDYDVKRSFFMRTSIVKIVALALVATVSFSSCATFFNNSESNITAASGNTSEVIVLENGSVVYQGPLPAIINVNGSNTYTVRYTDKEGNERTLSLQKKISGWFIADVLLIGGWIIDLITGNVMQYEKSYTLPISYQNSQQILLTDFIPEELVNDLQIRGNVYE
jgi:hypothetical protein